MSAETNRPGRSPDDPRVLHVVLSLNPGGTERLVLELASQLHATIPTAVCCLDAPGAWAGRLRDQGIVVSALERLAGVRPALGRAVAQAAAAHRATVIHAHHYSPFVYSAIAKLWRPSTRLVFTEHGRVSDAPPSNRRRLANRFLARVPGRVFAVSDELKAHLVAEGFPATSVGVIYNGIEAGAMPSPGDRARIRQALDVEDDTLVIGTVARLDPVKDLGTLIDAAARLASDRRIRIVIIGDGPEMSGLRQAASAQGISAAMTFLGHRDDARAWLAGFDVFVNCSTSEGVSLTILEAMAAGLPVVATAVGGTPEVVTEGCGFLVPPRSPERLANALQLLSTDPRQRQSLGTSGRLRVQEQFQLRRMISQYELIYRDAATSTGLP